MAAPSDLPSNHRCVPRDSVDLLIDSWRQRRPDLDFSPVGIVSRLGRVRSRINASLEEVFRTYGLSAADFAVLVTLARVGGEGGVSQRRLMSELGLTSGTISVRIDRLADAGHVKRRPDPESGRNALVSLTAAGREVFERAVPAHLANEERLLAALDEREREQLASLLRKLLVEFEGSLPPEDAPLRLGLTIAPAHETIRLRQSVGLEELPGLLVRGVEDGGPADAAGIRGGDVLVSVGGRELRAVAALYAAIADAVGHGELKLRVLRGTEELHTTIALDAAGAAEGTRATTFGRTGRGEHRI